MTTYSLKQVSTSTFQITSGGKKVGFVNRVLAGENEGKFLARLGQRVEVRSTSKGAFEAVCLPALGVSSRAELNRRAADVRQVRRIENTAADRALEAYYQDGNFEPVADLIEKGMIVPVLNAFGRSLKKRQDLTPDAATRLATYIAHTVRRAGKAA